jgi:hypothetical protein
MGRWWTAVWQCALSVCQQFSLICIPVNETAIYEMFYIVYKIAQKSE